MENPVINQLVSYKGKKYRVIKDLGSDRFRLKCAAGCPKQVDVHKDQITAA